MRAIVFDGERLKLVDDMTVRGPGPGEVKVRVLRSGICHSDLNMVGGGGLAPVVLGHEGAGVVAELGDGVSDFAIGERVVVGTQTPCGTCRECKRGTPANCDETWGIVPRTPFDWHGVPTYSFANVSSFAEEIVVRSSQLYRIGDLPLEQGALIGCAVSTGYAAARVLGEASPGDRVVVIGVGGIGVNAIAGARLAGAEVMAVDLNPAKEAAASEAGAGGFIAVSRDMDADQLAEAMRVAFVPIDTVIECSGAPVAAEAAVAAAKRGGRVVLIGQTKPGARLDVSLDAVTFGREIVGRLNGGARPEVHYPELVEHARQGRIDLAAQVTRVWPMEQYDEAIAALEAGQVTRAVLDLT
jgi:S-(hydroxymethyl)glutathione dehydrogenase/alcohol dehydrogenase